jgi:serine/threonine protein phosphatase 1
MPRCPDHSAQALGRGSIHSQRGNIGVIHAEVPIGMDWNTFKNAIQSGHEATIEACLTNRTRIHSGVTSPVDGVGRIFCGHTPQLAGGPKHLGNVVCVDTGAFITSMTGGLDRYPDAGLCMMQSTFGTEHLPQKKIVQPNIHLTIGHAHRPF